jgi:transglutaminase-like putative cysteine protease
MRIDRPVSQRQSWWLLATALAVFLPLTPQLPLPLALAAGAVMALRGLISWRQWHLPPRWLLALVTLAGAGLVLWHYRTIFGRTPGIALLSVFLALKLLELRVARDALALVLLAYFLVLANFMFSQSIGSGAIALATVVLTTAALAAASDDRPSPQSQLRRAGLMLLQGLPFMLVLFLLFPRIDGPLWGLPQDRHSSTSGLSDSMSPGSIAQMSQSDEVAFRVRFRGEVPAQPQLYWRGPVMPLFDGRTWRTSQSQPQSATPPYAIDPKSNEAVGYELTLEPHGQRWLFALELPTTLPAESGMTRDLQIIARQPVRNRLRYQLVSVPDTPHAGLARGERAEALTLPPEGNPRTRELGAQWRRNAEQASAMGGPASDVRILATAQEFFLRQLLQYTLTPPLLGRDSIDEFLFDTRRGFCEHFAAAFVVALRAAGVPARVVAGYQGGELNPVDGYLVVRQYDAHAWTEAWIDGRGWVRVDPTAISMPARIADSFASAAPAGEPLPLLARPDLAWLRELRDRADAIANGWNQWVLGYNSVRQREFLEKLGLESPDWQTMTAWLAGLCGTLLLALTGWALWQRQRHDPLRALWLRFTRKLARRNVHWHAWEGPQDFARRAALALPQAASDVQGIASAYAQLRYAPQPPADGLRELRQRIAALKL